MAPLTTSKKLGAKTVLGKRHAAATTKKAGPYRQSFVPTPAARPLAPALVTPAPHAVVTQESAPPTATATQNSETSVPPPSATLPEGTIRASTPEALSIEGELNHGHSALHFASALRSYFDALRAQTIAASVSTVRALQFGDSHTAADMFTGELRAQIQSRFGNGGVGFTYAGHPFAGYRILGSGRGQSGGWQTLGTHFTQLGDALLGMGGVAIETNRAGESAQLEANCTTLQVDYLRQPGGGSFSMQENGLSYGDISTDSTTAAPSSSGVATSVGSKTLACDPGLDRFQFVTEGAGPVRLLGTTALQPGATWEAIGINGAEAPLILRWNATLFDGYLQLAAPQLIVLAYGTNEAAGRWAGPEYAVTFASLIDKLHTLVPGASILVLGPGDRSLASSHSMLTGKGKHASYRVSRVYTPYAGTERIIAAQREVCSTHYCAFWDWQQRQGGFGAMNRWVAAGYAQPDHTHFTGTGYRVLADTLFADVMAAYDSATSQ